MSRKPTNEEIFEKIKTAMVDLLEIEEETISLQADIRDELALDSVDVFELLSELEDSYGLTITHEELLGMNVSTIEDVIAMVQKLIQRKGETASA